MGWTVTWDGRFLSCVMDADAWSQDLLQKNYFLSPPVPLLLIWKRQMRNLNGFGVVKRDPDFDG